MGQTKETTEVLQIGAKGVNAVNKSVKSNGGFNAGEDFQNFIPVLLALQPGINGAGLMKEEGLSQTPPDRELIKQQLISSLDSYDETTADLWADAIMGAHSIFSLAWRAGFNAGQQHIAQGNELLKV